MKTIYFTKKEIQRFKNIVKGGESAQVKIFDFLSPSHHMLSIQSPDDGIVYEMPNQLRAILLSAMKWHPDTIKSKFQRGDFRSFRDCALCIHNQFKCDSCIYGARYVKCVDKESLFGGMFENFAKKNREEFLDNASVQYEILVDLYNGQVDIHTHETGVHFKKVKLWNDEKFAQLCKKVNCQKEQSSYDVEPKKQI